MLFIQQLAERVNERRTEYERSHEGRRVPITPAMSRLLEHDLSYEPYRQRRPDRTHRPYRNPGVLTILEMANDLGTTVGDLLGERGLHRPKDAMSVQDRRTLRTLLRAVWRIFDLDDPVLLRNASEKDAAPQ